MANNKATGPDDIPAELWKSLGDTGVNFLCALFNKIPQDGIPDAWRKSYLVPFYKNKGDIRQCGNYRAIKLISHAFKIWERVLNERVRRLTTISENQCGFVPGRSTTDAIHTIRILMETYRARKQDLHMVFIDLEKAFDRVPRPLIWQALRSQNLPECYIDLIRDMYAGATTRVRCPAGISEEFHVKVGVHQGSALSPLLFNIVMNHLTAAIQRPVPWNILYADDVVLIDEDPQALQHLLEEWRSALETAGLRISRDKTEHMHCNFSRTNTHHIITLQDSTLKTVESFKYLGSVLSSDGNIDADITHRTNTAWQKWRELTGILCDSQMPIKTKGKVYKIAVRPAMTYGAECWPTTKAQLNKVHANEMRMLRWSAGVSLLDKVPNVYIRGSFKVRPISEKIQETRLRWYGHVMRRPEDHMTRKVLQLESGPRGRGRPRLTWISVIKQDLANDNLDPTTTQNRCIWRRRIRRADPK